MRAPPEPPHIDASAEGLSFKQYARAFCTFCCPIGERHREIELSWRRKHDPKNLEPPLNPNFYLLPVAEHPTHHITTPSTESTFAHFPKPRRQLPPNCSQVNCTWMGKLSLVFRSARVRVAAGGCINA